MSLASPKTEWALESGTAPGLLQPVPDLAPAYPIDGAATAVENTLARRLNDVAIRALDALVAAILLLTLLPLIVTAAVLVRLESPGPALYRAERVGFRGRRLLMLKFRKMRSDAAGLKLTVVGDERFTRIGGILARLKIDEIPQLWHVLKGEMSLVGPRPEDATYVTLHHDPYQEILSVRPGITGLSQIAFADESRILDLRNPHGHYVGRILPQKIALDSLYAERRTLWLNLRILFWTTAAVVMRRDVAVNRASGRMNLRRR